MGGPRIKSFVAALAILCSVEGCAPRPARTPSAPLQSDTSIGRGSEQELGRWGELELPELGLRLPLRDPSGWSRDRRAISWTVLEHARSSTLLRLRRWTTRDPATLALCESEARLTLDFPSREGSELIEERLVDRPAGFGLRVELRSRPAPREGALEGLALGFGARGRRCFAFVATTTSEGDGAASTIGQRLGDLVAGSLEGLRETSPLEVPRERLR